MEYRTARKINSIPALIGCILVTILATLFLVLSLFVFKAEIPENYVEVTAKIENIYEHYDELNDEYEYDVRIGYTYNNVEYNDKEYHKYDFTMKTGSEVLIYVNPDNPSEFYEDTNDSFIFPLLSGIFAVAGIVGCVYNIKKLKELKRREE